METRTTTTTTDELRIEEVPVERILDLRHCILRAGLSHDAAHFDGDREPGTLHFAALAGDQVIGCATFLRRPWNDQPAWQLRGMAVSDGHRGGRVGTRILDVAEQRLREIDYSRQLWCNARTPAMHFYQRLGWETFGEIFDVPAAGPHVKMTKRLS